MIVNDYITLQMKYKEECEEYNRLNTNFKREKQNMSQMYLISKSWLNNWKEASDYNKQKQKDKWKRRQHLRNDLEEIDNSELLKDTQCEPAFYKFKENEIFIENYDERKNQPKYINKEIWEFFKDRYGSNPEQPPLIVGWEKNEEIQEKIKYIKIAVINLSDNNVEYKPQNFTRLVNTKTTFKEFKEDIEKYYFSIFISNNNTEISYWLLLDKIGGVNINNKVQEVKELFERANIPDYLRSFDNLGLQNCFYDLPYQLYYLFIIINNINSTQNITRNKFEPLNVLGKCAKCGKDCLVTVKCKRCYEFLYCSTSCISDPKHDEACWEQLSRCKEFLDKNKEKSNIGLKGDSAFAFVNTTFQCLSNCVKLKNYLITTKQIIDGGLDKLLFELTCVMIILWKADENTDYRYDSSKLKNLLNKAGFIPNKTDMHEFLLYLLNHIHNVLIPISDKKCEVQEIRGQGSSDEQLEQIIKGKISWRKLESQNTIITQLFYGQFIYTLTCKKCNYKKILYELFLTLSIPIVIIYIEFISTDFTKFYFNIPFKQGKIFTLRQIISELIGVNKFSFIMYWCIIIIKINT